MRLECTEKPQIVWSNEPALAQLETISPSAADNLLAQEKKNQNATSAVLILKVDDKRIIFAADSDVTQWRSIFHRAKTKLACDILAVPHHAGNFHSNEGELAWLFDEAISPDVGIVSVGTSNTYDHPRQDVIRALTSRGTKILCTQITKQCNLNNRNLEYLRPGVLQPLIQLGMSSVDADTNERGNSRNVACAGTVRASISKTKVIVERLSEHQSAVDRLVKNGRCSPLCRPDL